MKKKFLWSAIVSISALIAVITIVKATTIGTNISSAVLTLLSTTEPQVTVQYDASDYLTAGVGATGIVTFNSVGSALRNALTFSDPVTVATTSQEALLTINGNSSSTTLGVYSQGSGDIVNVFTDATEIFTILDNGNVGIGSTTPTGVLTLLSTTNPQVYVQYDTSNYFTAGVSSAGLTTFNSIGSALRNVFTFSDPVTVATTSAEALLTVYGNSSSTTLAVYSQGTGDIVNVFTDATEIFTILDSGNVGVGTTTPSAKFSVGNTGTTTLDLGKFCARSLADDGTTVIYWWLGYSPTKGTVNIATSTTSCF